MAIQWFPGHMHLTRKAIEERIKEIDVVIELLDARLPGSSANPMLALTWRAARSFFMSFAVLPNLPVLACAMGATVSPRVQSSPLDCSVAGASSARDASISVCKAATRSTPSASFKVCCAAFQKRWP